MSALPLNRMVIFRRRVVGLTEIGLARLVARVARILQLTGQVDVLITSSSEMQSLNRRFLKKDHATDVLSFPYEPGSKGSLAGELAISSDLARQNARLLGHSMAEEVKVLILHGMLHLAGYDHDHKDDGGKMSRKEDRLRMSLQLPRGLVSRSQDARTKKSELK
ncbi:MAG: rRNA maturation RNase YbeY, partial [Acidobacteriota bacterium]|nr:rRNA maturation RNase YbeY [Acidobacteriota bacterium]